MPELTTARGKARCQSTTQCSRPAKPGQQHCAQHAKKPITDVQLVAQNTPAARAELFHRHPEYKRLYAQHAATSAEGLASFEDLVVDIRALLDFSASIDTASDLEFLKLRMATISSTLDNLVKYDQLRGRDDRIEQAVRARIAGRIAPVISAFESLFQKFIPEDLWEDAVDALRNAARTAVQSQITSERGNQQ